MKSPAVLVHPFSFLLAENQASFFFRQGLVYENGLVQVFNSDISDCLYASFDDLQQSFEIPGQTMSDLNISTLVYDQSVRDLSQAIKNAESEEWEVPQKAYELLEQKLSLVNQKIND